MDCKSVGPSSRCFCGHLFKHHATDNVTDRNVHCREPGCPCKLFCLIPGHGSRYIKCRCKHDYDDHSCTGKKKCKKCDCGGFDPTQSCPCGYPHRDHETVYESYEERRAAGRPVQGIAGSEGAGYAGLGAVTDFSSLVDGCDRLALGPPEGHGVRGGQQAIAALPGSQIETVAQSMAYSDQVREFYLVHNPGKLEDGTAERLLEQHRGREDELLRKIKQKYSSQGGAGGGNARTKAKKAIKEKPAWVDVVPGDSHEEAALEPDPWTGAFSPPKRTSIRSQAPFSHHGQAPPTEEPMSELDALHAKYDSKYGKPRKR